MWTGRPWWTGTKTNLQVFRLPWRLPWRASAIALRWTFQAVNSEAYNTRAEPAIHSIGPVTAASWTVRTF